MSSATVTAPRPAAATPGAPTPVAAPATSIPATKTSARGLTRVRFTIQTTDHKENELDLPALMGTVVTEDEFTGGLEGTGGAAYVMLFLPNGAEMDGQLVFKGKIDGRSGTVVFRVRGNCLSSINVRLKIIPESATGELRGIHGEGYYASDNAGSGRAEGELEIEYI